MSYMFLVTSLKYILKNQIRKQHKYILYARSWEKANNGTAAKTRKKIYNLKKSLNETGYDKTKNLKKVNK